MIHNNNTDITRVLSNLSAIGQRDVLKPVPVSGTTQEKGALLSIHAAWEIITCLDGQMHCVFARKRRGLHRGQSIAIPPGTAHVAQKHTTPTPSGNWLSIALDDNGTILIRVVDGLRTQALMLLSDPQTAAIHDILGQLPKDFLQRLSTMAGTHLGDALLAVWFAALAHVIDRPEGVPPHQIVRAIESLMHVHLADPDLTVAEIAVELGYTPNHLNTLYRRLTGRTIHRALLSKRLACADALLQEPHYTIKEIATICGWRDQRYFATVFRRYRGHSPREWRQALT